MPPITIYADSFVEGEWFSGLSPRLDSARHRKLGPRGQNPPPVDALVEYDRPDIVLSDDGEPVLVLEKTGEVPTGHNVGQRMARLVRAVEREIPVIKFFPFDARKHGDHSSVCNLNIRLIRAFEEMTEIHDTPTLAVNWPADEHGELVDDGSENERISDLVHAFVETGFDPRCPAFRAQLDRMEEAYQRRLEEYRQYGDPPPSVRILETGEVLAEMGEQLTDEVSAALRRREETVVYKIGMSPENCRREDPYTGTQFIYDYIWCRDGPEPEDKRRNLILHLPKIPRRRWREANPNDPSRKSCNWYLTANALVYRDTSDLLRA